MRLQCRWQIQEACFLADLNLHFVQSGDGLLRVAVINKELLE